MKDKQVILITGTRKGIGNHLAEYYAKLGHQVIGCSRKPLDHEIENYKHFCLDVCKEAAVRHLFADIKKDYVHLDILINNAGIASMNHILLTPVKTVQKMLDTNITGTFLFCREAAKLMQKSHYGRIVNFTTVAVPLKLEGEAVYASTKAAVISLTQIMAKELSKFGITVNAIGPTPIKTDIIRSVPEHKLEQLIKQQAINRFGEFKDVTNVINFFIKPESDFITGQVIYLGGI